MFFRDDALSAGNGLGPDEWWKGAVVYQIYPRSFKDSNGDGFGDLEGIRQKLDYLKNLGVDVLWLSPIYASPQADNGYDIADYYDIDPMFGTLEDFDCLLADVHERGMRLVMDLVVNHSSDENPWFVESRSSRDNPKRDWYIWRDPRPGHVGGEAGAQPNNWGSFFSGSAWAWDEATGQYYLHLFDKKQPDLNWDNPEVRAAVYEMMNWWLDRGVDGFRMDVINLISKDPALPDGIVYPGRAWGEGYPHFSEGPHLHDYLAEMRREVFAGRAGTMTVGECPGVRRDNVLLFTDPARRELDMVFQFDHVDLGLEAGKFHPRPLRPGELADCLSAWQEAQGSVGWNSLYLDNHDQPRAVSRFGDEAHRYASATALATALHMLRGTPYVYQGEELGMTNGVFHGLDDFRDVEALRYYREAVAAGRTPSRSWPGCAPPAATTGGPPFNGTRGRTRASPTAPRGSASPRTTRRSTPPLRWVTRPPCTPTIGRSRTCATACPSSRRVRSSASLRPHPQSSPTGAPSTRPWPRSWSICPLSPPPWARSRAG